MWCEPVYVVCCLTFRNARTALMVKMEPLEQGCFVTDDDKRVLVDLAAGNVCAKRWALKCLGRRRLAFLHQVMQNASSAVKLGVSSEEVAAIKAIPEEDVRLIRATWGAATQLWQKYERMVMKMTMRFAARVGINSSDLPDLQGEATVAFLKAVRGYSDTSFEFSTYFCCCVKTELRRYVKRCRGLSGGNEKLLIMYRAKHEELFACGMDCSFDAVCTALNFTKKQREKCWGTLQEPVSEGDLVEPLSKVVAKVSATGVDPELVVAISMVEMSELERDAFVSQESIRELFPKSYKTMREVATVHSCTPQAAAFAAIRATEKIKGHLRKQFA